MSRIKIPSREEVPEASQPVLEKVGKMLGFVPNLHRLMAISPPALTGWAGLMGSLSTTLDVKTRDGIALAVSEADGCNYCLAAHSYSARNLAKVDENEIAINREGRSADPKRQAAIMFAKRLIETLVRSPTRSSKPCGKPAGPTRRIVPAKIGGRAAAHA